MWIDTHCHLDAPEFGADHALALLDAPRVMEAEINPCIVTTTGAVAVDALARTDFALVTALVVCFNKFSGPALGWVPGICPKRLPAVPRKVLFESGAGQG